MDGREIREEIGEEIMLRRFIWDFPLSFQGTFFLFLALQHGVCCVLYSIFRNFLSSAFRRRLLIFNAFGSILSYEGTWVLVNRGVAFFSV
jgi:hypothetical protein